MSTTQSGELLDAVRQFLREDVLPELEGFKAYNTRVAANALGIVARELALGGELDQLDNAIAAALELRADDGSVARQIALGLRDGELVVDDRLLDYLRKRTLTSLAIDNPRYSGLAQARELWGE